MSSLRAPLSLVYAIRYTRPIQQRSSRYGHTFLRTCSSSAPRSFVQAKPAVAIPRPDADEPPDHRALAHAQKLLVNSPYSPGSPLFLPNGTYIVQKLQNFLRAQYPQFGFQEVITPNIYKKSLWEKSGHWENYAKDMFSVVGRGATGQTENAQEGQDEEFGLKPMNCPGHCLLFDKIGTPSYRDLPVRYADFSSLHRNEISGALTGLTRVRRFHQDDAHIFCRPDQILEEIENTLKFVRMVYSTFGLGDYKLLLSTRPDEHFIGTVSEWDEAESQLKDALNKSGSDWSLSPKDGAFYGPKIDIILTDAQGKEHQTATIQLDFQLPQRFDLQYKAPTENSPEKHEDNLNHTFVRPVIIHRAIYGSLERFLALLIEHYNGRYPLWLSPQPAVILSLNDDPEVISHVTSLQHQISGVASSDSQGNPIPQNINDTILPVAIDVSSRPLSKKIALARQVGYNFILVIGPKEAQNNKATVQIGGQPQSSRERVTQILGSVTGFDNDETKENRITMNAEQVRPFLQSCIQEYL